MSDERVEQVLDELDPTPAHEAAWPVSRRQTLRALASVGALAAVPGASAQSAGTVIADEATFSNYGSEATASGYELTIEGETFAFDGSSEIGLPDGATGIAVVTPGGASAAEVVGPDGSVVFDGNAQSTGMHLTLNESSGSSTVSDATGNGNSGTVPSEVTLGVSGQFDTAAAHDGTADTAIEVANDSSLEPTDVFSISVWVYPTTSGQQAVLDMRLNYTIFFDRNGSQGFNFATYGNNIDLGTGYSYNQWHHVAVSWDVGNSVDAWVNNTRVLDSVTYTDTPIPSADNPLTLFSQVPLGSGDQALNGRIDEPRIMQNSLVGIQVDSLFNNNDLG